MVLLRIVGVTAFLFAVALICSACVAAPPTPTITTVASPVVIRPTPTPFPTNTAIPTATPVPTATPAPHQLTVWVAEPVAAQAVVSDTLQQAAHIAGIEVLIVAHDPDGLLLSLATDRLLGLPPPDLIWANQEGLVGLLADQLLSPLDIELPADLLPGLRSLAGESTTVWGAPITAQDMLLLLYQPDRALPTTVADLVTSAQAARTPARAGFVQGWGAARWMAPWFYAAGGSFTTPDGTEPALDTPAMTATLTLLRDLYRAAPRNGDSYARGQRLLAQGMAAYAIDGDWAWQTYQTISDTFQIGVAPLPAFAGAPAKPLIGGSLLMRHRAGQATTTDVTALLKTLYQPEVQLRLSAALGRLPALSSLLTDTSIQSDPRRAAAAVHAAIAPGLPPTPAVRCAIFGVESYL